MPLIEAIAPRGVAYVGDGELARICKIAHNVMLGVVIENLIEITLLANKMGVPRHAFLDFINNSVMGSMFTPTSRRRWSISTGPPPSRRSCCARISISASSSAASGRADAGDGGDARGAAEAISAPRILQENPKEYLQKDFAALAETMALAAGMKLTPENKNVPTGLE